MDEAKLPPAAAGKVDFTSQIKPILDAHCLKCHGPVKPKGGFRVDTRAGLLAGGDEHGTNVVVLGHSSRSALIHFVSHAVEDMEMPPVGKGEKLSAEQVGLLRAWIDQDLEMPEAAPTQGLQAFGWPTIGFVFVDGNRAKFRQHQWTPHGLNGGYRQFDFRDTIDDRTRLTLTGHALRDDYLVRLSLERDNLGFVRAGWKQFSHYFDDYGGPYLPFRPDAFRLDRKLALDVGRAWAEAGLTKPGWPQVTVGYEYQYQNGEKSLTQWLPETQVVSGGSRTRNIAPNTKDIDQHTHLIRLDLDHNFRGLRIEDQFRYEFHDANTVRRGALESAIVRDPFVRANEGYDHRRWANAFRLERQLKDWLLVSGGYLYTDHDGEASIQLNTVNAAGVPAAGNFWRGSGIVLDQSAHTFNANVQAGPWQGLTLAGGVQSEWSEQDGLGRVMLDDGDDASPLTFTNATLSANLDRFSVEENFVLRFTKIPYTVLFADARLRQEEIGQFERETGGGHHEFLRDTDNRNDWKDWRAGFQTSPWRPISLSAHYRQRERDSKYDHRRDFGVTNSPGNGYSAFLRHRDTHTDEVEAKLVVRPAQWLKTTLSYKVVATDFRTETASALVFPLRLRPPGGERLAGNYDAHVYSANLTLTPWRRLYLSTTFSWQNSRIVTLETNVSAVSPYRGDVASVLASANYVLDGKTDLQASYSFSWADYRQHQDTFGLPLGLEYTRHGIQAGITRQITKNVGANLQYGWYRYDEPSASGLFDYIAHAVFATLHIRWP